MIALPSKLAWPNTAKFLPFSSPEGFSHNFWILGLQLTVDSVAVADNKKDPQIWDAAELERGHGV